jgi:hypothetical protein
MVGWCQFHGSYNEAAKTVEEDLRNREDLSERQHTDSVRKTVYEDSLEVTRVAVEL